MSPDVLLECPRTSFRDVLRVNVTERVWHSPWGVGGCSTVKRTLSIKIVVLKVVLKVVLTVLKVVLTVRAPSNL